MASDADYESFLDKANNQSSTSTAQSSSSSGFKTLKASDAEIPSALGKVGDNFYTSDTDEPFQAVAYEFSGELEIEAVQKLLDTSGVQSIDIKDFDPKGQYSGIIDQVLKAAEKSAKDEIKVFRVPHQGSRVEYFLLCPHKDGKRVVGVSARAVE